MNICCLYYYLFDSGLGMACIGWVLLGCLLLFSVVILVFCLVCWLIFNCIVLLVGWEFVVWVCVCCLVCYCFDFYLFALIDCRIGYCLC